MGRVGRPRIAAELVDGLYVVGDEAYLPDEWEHLQRQRQKWREYHQRNRERRNEQARRWQAEHPERFREIRRESARRRRQEARGSMRIVASLHDLACAGPTKPTGCRCHKILIVREARAA